MFQQSKSDYCNDNKNEYEEISQRNQNVQEQDEFIESEMCKKEYQEEQNDYLIETSPSQKVHRKSRKQSKGMKMNSASSPGSLKANEKNYENEENEYNNQDDEYESISQQNKSSLRDQDIERDNEVYQQFSQLNDSLIEQNTQKDRDQIEEIKEQLEYVKSIPDKQTKLSIIREIKHLLKKKKIIDSDEVVTHKKRMLQRPSSSAQYQNQQQQEQQQASQALRQQRRDEKQSLQGNISTFTNTKDVSPQRIKEVDKAFLSPSKFNGESRVKIEETLNSQSPKSNSRVLTPTNMAYNDFSEIKRSASPNRAEQLESNSANELQKIMSIISAKPPSTDLLNLLLGLSKLPVEASIRAKERLYNQIQQQI